MQNLQALSTEEEPPPARAVDILTANAQRLESLVRARCSTIGEFRALVGRAICELDERLSHQMNSLIGAAPFQKLEALWRGLDWVLADAHGTQSLKLKILDASWEEISHDLNTAPGLRRTLLYRTIAMRELDTPGGEPFGIAMIDHGLSFDIETEFDDFYSAQLLCDTAEACVCPFVMTVAPDFFGENDAAWMTDTRRLNSILTSEPHAPWQRLRKLANARFLGLALPAVLLRPPYEDSDQGFRFHQWPSQSDGLWGSACYAFLRTVISEYRRSAWFGYLKLIGDAPGQGAVLARSADDPVLTEVRLSRGVGHFLSEAGFIPLCQSTKSPELYFFGNRSIFDCDGQADAEVLTQIQSVLIACRLVHYIKVQIRALIGQLKSASECELVLNNWLETYCSNLAEASTELLAKYPLRDARVRVTDGDAGDARFTCEIVIRPQYQIDHMSGDIRLSTELGPAAEAA